MTTTVAIEGYAVEGRHGAEEWEWEQPQTFRISAWVELGHDPLDERLVGTLDYGRLQQVLHDAVASDPPCRLLEAVCERVLERLRSDPIVAGVQIRLEKPHAPLPLPGGLALVERAWRRG